jgi:hypothetical protein
MKSSQGEQQTREKWLTLFEAFEQHEEQAVLLHTIRHNPQQLFSVVRLVQCEKELSATAKQEFSNEGLNLGSVVSVEVDHLL